MLAKIRPATLIAFVGAAACCRHASGHACESSLRRRRRPRRRAHRGRGRPRFRGCRRFNVVGLPDTAVQEARERVRSAVRNSGCFFPIEAHHGQPRAGRHPQGRAALRPADRRRRRHRLRAGARRRVATALFLGELSLDGRLRSTQGILPMVSLARERGLHDVYVPAADAAEAALVEGVTIYPVETLSRPRAPPQRRRADRALRAERPTSSPKRRRATTAPTSPRCAARSTSSARWRSRRRAGTTC